MRGIRARAAEKAANVLTHRSRRNSAEEDAAEVMASARPPGFDRDKLAAQKKIVLYHLRLESPGWHKSQLRPQLR